MWRIYYSDGSTRDSGDGPPKGDAARDVQVIVQDHPSVGKQLVTATDFFIWRDGRWLGVDWWGLMDFLLDSGVVCFGRMITDEEYSRIMTQATRDRDKTGWAIFERKP